MTSSNESVPNVLKTGERFEYNKTLLQRMGGRDNLEVTLLAFYEKVVADPKLFDFFDNVDMGMLRMHQKRFLILAFTNTIPPDFDVVDFLWNKHKRLFGMGLNESHFDLVAGHLVDALKQMWVDKDVIQDIVAVVSPLRIVFEESSREERRLAMAAKQKKDLKKLRKQSIPQNTPDILKPGKDVDYNATLLYRIGGEGNLEAVLSNFFDRTLEDDLLEPYFGSVDMKVLISHQKRFLALAFTNEIPDEFDAPSYILDRHMRLFEKGLNETHFDQVAHHLVAALKECKATSSVIEEIVDIVLPFREVFQASGRAQKIAALKQVKRYSIDLTRLLRRGSTGDTDSTSKSCTSVEDTNKSVGSLLRRFHKSQL